VEADLNIPAPRIVRPCTTGVPDTNNSDQCHRPVKSCIAFVKIPEATRYRLVLVQAKRLAL